MSISPAKVLEDFKSLPQSMPEDAPVFVQGERDGVYNKGKQDGREFLILFKQGIGPIQEAAQAAGASFVLKDLEDGHKKLLDPVYDVSKTKYMGSAGELLGETRLLLGRLAQTGEGADSASDGPDKTLYWLLGGLGVLTLLGLGAAFLQARQERLSGALEGEGEGGEGGDLELSESEDGSFAWQGAPGVALVGPGRS